MEPTTHTLPIYTIMVRNQMTVPDDRARALMGTGPGAEERMERFRDAVRRLLESRKENPARVDTTPIADWITAEGTDAVRKVMPETFQITQIPWPDFWIEVRAKNGELGWGCMVIEDTEDPPLSALRGLGLSFGDYDRSVSVIGPFVAGERRGDLIGPLGRSTIFLDDQGSIAHRSETYFPDDEESRLWTRKTAAYAILTLQLLNMRNIETVEVQPVLTRQRRRLLERTGDTLHSFHELRIRPTLVRKVPANQLLPLSAMYQGTTRQHRVRGYSITYTAEKPLFGKHVGTFLVPAHLRGNPNRGTVDKVYVVDPT